MRPKHGDAIEGSAFKVIQAKKHTMQRFILSRYFIFSFLASCGSAFFNAIGPIQRHTTQLEGTTRRDFTAGALLTILPTPAFATEVFTRQTDQFAYQFQPPENFGAGNKPLRTHLDEINFKSESVSGYQYGITVDPVRIESLRQFGTPEEVAAKVVLAEVNRDGVFDVTLMKDPIAGPNDSYYQLNYQSKGKRGTKRFVAKFYIQNQKLYALTAQCKEDDYNALESEMLKTVETFQLL